MVPVATSIAEMLKAYSDTLPVDRLSKPTVFEDLERIVFPVLSFDGAPLASPLLRFEQFKVNKTLVGAENAVSFTSTDVPPREIHRYIEVAVSNGSAASRKFNLITNYRDSAGIVVGGSRIVHQDIRSSTLTNLLSNTVDAGIGARNWTGMTLDLYPGSFWKVENDEILDNLSLYRCTGIRLVYRGPSEKAAVDISDDIKSAAS